MRAGGNATVTELLPASVKVTDRRIVATAGGHEWSWLLSDLERVSHGGREPWSILAVPGVDDHGVAVPREDSDSFRATLRHLADTGSIAVDLSDPPHPPPPRPVDPPPVVPPEPPAAVAPPAPIVDLTPTVTDRPAPAAATALAGLDARAISAWFGTHHVLDRVSLDDAGGRGDRADRPVGLRQVDVPADPQPDARDDPVGVAGRRGAARRRRHLRRPARKLTDARRQIGMVFQKPNPFPAMSIYDNVVASFRLTGHEGRPRTRRTTSSSRASPRPASGTRSAIACASRAAGCPVASSSGCASPGRSPSGRACC